MTIPRPITIDFETGRIKPRPEYPPKPVGVSIKYPGKRAKYYAWGHPTANNCTFEVAKKALEEAYRAAGVYRGAGDGLLFHNAKFDLDVAETFLDMPPVPASLIHDTMLLLFLHNPNSKVLALKPAAELYLDMPPEEQDKVADWLLKNQPLKGQGIKITKSGPAAKHPTGAYICLAPGKLVGAYANGDVIRTEKLFNLLYRDIAARNMLEAYDRERKILPILLEMERQGVRVDLDQLQSDVAAYSAEFGRVEYWIKKQLGNLEMNIDSDQQLFNMLEKAELVDESLLDLTDTGKPSMKMESIKKGITNPVIYAMLSYRAQLKTRMSTFMLPWLDVAIRSGGFIFTTWNQTKQERGGGARTGRLSSTPNFQNVPKVPEPIFKHEEKDPAKAKLLPRCPLKGLPPLPEVRKYIVPYAEGDVLIDRDYSQQEPRIFAHFEGSDLLVAYCENPWMDLHDFAKEELEKSGRKYERKPVKTVNLGILYGMGINKLSEKLNMSKEDTKELRAHVRALYPGLEEMDAEMRERARTGLSIRTWGGREYYVEEPSLVGGRMRSKEYKLINTLIQGSGADCTKEAIIRLHDNKAEGTRILLQVHDELLCSTPAKLVRQEMETMRQTMESVEFDVPMLSEGKISETNWSELRDYDKKGVIL